MAPEGVRVLLIRLIWFTSVAEPALHSVAVISSPMLLRSPGEARSRRRPRVRWGEKGRFSIAKPSGTSAWSMPRCKVISGSTSPVTATQITRGR